MFLQPRERLNISTIATRETKDMVQSVGLLVICQGLDRSARPQMQDSRPTNYVQNLQFPMSLQPRERPNIGIIPTGETRYVVQSMGLLVI